MNLFFRNSEGHLCIGEPADPAAVQMLRLAGSGVEFTGCQLDARLLEYQDGNRQLSSVRWWWPLTGDFFSSGVASDLSGFQFHSREQTLVVSDAGEGVYFNAPELEEIAGPYESVPVDFALGAEISLDFRPNPNWKGGYEHDLNLPLGERLFQIHDWPDGYRWYSVVFEYLGTDIYIWIDDVLWHTETLNLASPIWIFPGFEGFRNQAERTGTCRNLRVRKRN